MAAFVTSKASKALAVWYRDVLGIHLESWGGAILRNDAPGLPPMALWNAMPRNSEEITPSNRECMINFAVDDLDAFVKGLEAKGVTGANWLSASSRFWALGPLQAALTIFDGGRRAAGVKIARAHYDEAAATYRQTVLTAFREVEDDLAAGRLLVASEADQAVAAKADERTRDLALTRYHDGAADYLEVVTPQNDALDAERALLDLRARRLQTASDTFRALGGAVSSVP